MGKEQAIDLSLSLQNSRMDISEPMHSPPVGGQVLEARVKWKKEAVV